MHKDVNFEKFVIKMYKNLYLILADQKKSDVSKLKLTVNARQYKWFLGLSNILFY